MAFAATFYGASSADINLGKSLALNLFMINLCAFLDWWLFTGNICTSTETGVVKTITGVADQIVDQGQGALAVQLLITPAQLRLCDA